MGDGDGTVLIRAATIDDVDVIARHRSAMFLDMGSATQAVVDQLERETRIALRDAIPRGTYLGWLAMASADAGRVIGGVGVLMRWALPFPKRLPDGGAEIAQGRQALVVNVYTEPSFRRRGVARRLMLELLQWAQGANLDSLVLHAAPDGRALYESLGFAATNELRYAGDIRLWVPPGGTPPNV